MQSLVTLPYSTVQSVAVIGNHLPRKCGIATFTTDLVNAINACSSTTHCWTLAMNDTTAGYAYPAQVKFELNQKQLSDYRLAASFLNIHQPDVICVQHEYGIFGGPAGSHLLKLLSEVRAPVVTTLHTVLTDPSDDYRHVMKRLADYSDRLVVMSNKAIDILQRVYHIPREKIAFVPHGIPDMPFVDPNYYKDQFGVMGKRVILTFGLLSQNKGIEVAIQAMAEVVKKHPDVAYIVLGATHPHVKQHEGEAYRLRLQQQVRQLGLEKHIIFQNRFVTLEELCEYLAAADIYVTPYINEEQITSGTLAYAMGTGKPVVSTPYWYAEEMLADERGILVPFRNSEALADALNELLDNEQLRNNIRKRAYDFCRQATWHEVARQYMSIFASVKAEREQRPKPYRPLPQLVGNRAFNQELPELKLDHFFKLTDDTGMFQHAKYTIPDRNHGYCTDDNARALIVAAEAANLQSDHTGRLYDLTDRFLSFLLHAFNTERGQFRNFMSYNRGWLEEVGSEDAHGRAMWALGRAALALKEQRQLSISSSLFMQALPACESFEALRSKAFTLLGMHTYLQAFSGDSDVRRMRNTLANSLLQAFEKHASADWYWPEDTLTYDNARLCEALICSGHAMDNASMLNTGLQGLRWLMTKQSDKGHFVAIGNHGWGPKNAAAARFDQQPIEAWASVEACISALLATSDRFWFEQAMLAFNWFLGNNDLSLPLYDAQTGGCCDGLEANGVNQNQGAESTLAWLLSLISLHRVSANDQLANAASLQANYGVE